MMMMMTITGSPVDVHGEDWQIHPGVCSRLSHCWTGEYLGMMMMMMMIMMMMMMMMMKRRIRPGRLAHNGLDGGAACTGSPGGRPQPGQIHSGSPLLRKIRASLFRKLLGLKSCYPETFRFLARLVALHFTPVSKSVGDSFGLGLA